MNSLQNNTRLDLFLIKIQAKILPYTFPKNT